MTGTWLVIFREDLIPFRSFHKLELVCQRIFDLDPQHVIALFERAASDILSEGAQGQSRAVFLGENISLRTGGQLALERRAAGDLVLSMAFALALSWRVPPRRLWMALPTADRSPMRRSRVARNSNARSLILGRIWML